MPTPRIPALATVVITVAGALTLAACTGSDDVTPTPSTSAVATATPTASPTSSPTATATADATPEPTATATEPDVIETITVDDLDMVVGSTANSFGTTDPESVFEATYGGLGEGDGVTVTHSTGTTSSGAPLLIVEMSPAEGNGGDVTLTFYALWDDAVVEGSYSSPDSIGDEARVAFEARAAAAVHP
ncbi:hypothetical protein [Demequina rhizosphaerae]|uniref:hypothetical protein n=1 Tax=Demequina rhizosphaerae TaxID=1638985 RepID=UPI0007866D69|nr:hypothetical protein [Demequina rhizosphaerae]